MLSQHNIIHLYYEMKVLLYIRKENSRRTHLHLFVNVIKKWKIEKLHQCKRITLWLLTNEQLYLSLPVQISKFLRKIIFYYTE